MKFIFALVGFVALHAHAEEEECDASPQTAGSSALLQVRKGSPPNLSAAALPTASLKDMLLTASALSPQSSKTCSYSLIEDQDGSQMCEHLAGRSYISGADADLDETGYKETAQLCCHHEMSLFVRREIARQGFDVCDLSDLHGFVHWYDCSEDISTDMATRPDVGEPRTFALVQAEIARGMTSHCPWLGHLPSCPAKGENCAAPPPCVPEDFPADSQAGSSAPLDDAGYLAVAKRCCHTEMEEFVRRQIEQQGFQICDEGVLQGFLNWFDCSSDNTDRDDEHFDDDQTYETLKEGLVMARSGLPPLCPWLGGIGEACAPKGHHCQAVDIPEPEAHRRRTACR